MTRRRSLTVRTSGESPPQSGEESIEAAIERAKHRADVARIAQASLSSGEDRDSVSREASSSLAMHGRRSLISPFSIDKARRGSSASAAVHAAAVMNQQRRRRSLEFNPELLRTDNVRRREVVVRLLDGTPLLFDVLESTTVLQLCIEIKKRLGLRSDTDFGLFEVHGGRFTPAVPSSSNMQTIDASCTFTLLSDDGAIFTNRVFATKKNRRMSSAEFTASLRFGKNARDGGKGRRTSRLKGQRRASFGGAVGGLSASIAKAIAATNRTPIEGGGGGGAGGVGGGGGGGAGNLPKSLQSAQSQSGSDSVAGTKLQGQHKMLSPRGTGVSSSAPLSPRGELTYRRKVAQRLHDAWRGARELRSDGSRQPRLKLVDGAEFDIANLVFSQLPIKLQHANLEAAREACHNVESALAYSTLNELREGSSFLEEASELQHQNWMEHNIEWADEPQLIPYSDLSEAEKEKDRLIVRIAIDEYASYLRSMYTTGAASERGLTFERFVSAMVKLTTLVRKSGRLGVDADMLELDSSTVSALWEEGDRLALAKAKQHEEEHTSPWHVHRSDVSLPDTAEREKEKSLQRSHTSPSLLASRAAKQPRGSLALLRSNSPPVTRRRRRSSLSGVEITAALGALTRVRRKQTVKPGERAASALANSIGDSAPTAQLDPCSGKNRASSSQSAAKKNSSTRRLVFRQWLYLESSEFNAEVNEAATADEAAHRLRYIDCVWGVANEHYCIGPDDCPTLAALRLYSDFNVAGVGEMKQTWATAQQMLAARLDSYVPARALAVWGHRVERGGGMILHRFLRKLGDRSPVSNRTRARGAIMKHIMHQHAQLCRAAPSRLDTQRAYIHAVEASPSFGAFFVGAPAATSLTASTFGAVSASVNGNADAENARDDARPLPLVRAIIRSTSSGASASASGVEEETYSALGVSEQGIVLRSSLGAVRFHAFSEMMSWTFGAHNSSLTYLIPGRLHSREVVVDGLQISSVLAMIRQYQGVLGSLTVQSYERSSTRLAHAGRKANFPFATTTTSANSIRNVSTTASNSDPLKKQLSPKPRARRRRRSSAAISRRHTAHKGVRPDVLAPSDDNTETIAEFQLAREDLETSIAKSRNAMESAALLTRMNESPEQQRLRSISVSGTPSARRNLLHPHSPHGARFTPKQPLSPMNVALPGGARSSSRTSKPTRRRRGSGVVDFHFFGQTAPAADDGRASDASPTRGDKGVDAISKNDSSHGGRRRPKRSTTKRRSSISRLGDAAVAAATAAFSGKVSPTEQHSGDPSMTPSRRSTRRGMGTGQRRSSFAAVGSGSSQTVLATTSANGRGLPSGFVAIRNPGSGRVAYFHAASGAVSMSRPTDTTLQNVRDAVLVVVDRDRGPICSALAYKDIPDDAI